MTNEIEQFQRKLSALKQDFILLSSLPSLKVHLQFLGKFKQHVVVWDANLEALGREGGAKSYIHIGEHKNNKVEISIGIAENSITKPVIYKTIIMIRNYRNLATCSHFFGS